MSKKKEKEEGTEEMSSNKPSSVELSSVCIQVKLSRSEAILSFSEAKSG